DFLLSMGVDGRTEGSATAVPRPSDAAPRRIGGLGECDAPPARVVPWDKPRGQSRATKGAPSNSDEPREWTRLPGSFSPSADGEKGRMRGRQPHRFGGPHPVPLPLARERGPWSRSSCSAQDFSGKVFEVRIWTIMNFQTSRLPVIRLRSAAGG